jgi:hypothetical protein
MGRSKYTEEQIAFALKQAELGTPPQGTLIVLHILQRRKERAGL